MQRAQKPAASPVPIDAQAGRATIGPDRSARLAMYFDRLVLGGLLLSLAILPLQPNSSVLPIGMSVGLLFLWVARAAVEKRALIRWTPIHLVLLLFLGIVLLQLVPWPFQIQTLHFSETFKGMPAALAQWRSVTLNRQATLKAAAGLASLLGYFFVAVNIIDSERRRRQVINWIIFFGFAISLLGVLDKLSDPGDPLLRGLTLPGLYYHSLYRVSGYIEMVFPLPLAMLFAGGIRRDEWVWYGFAAITIGIGVASAGTTGAVFVLAVELMGLFLLAMTRRSKTRKFGPAKTNKVWMAVGAAVIIGTIITGVAWLATQSLQVIESDVATHVEELSQGQKEFPYSRIGIWKSSWQLIADHPILGTGWGAFSTAYQRYDTGDGSRVVKEAHNDYLQVVCDTGIAGGIVLGVFLGLLLRVIWRSLGSEESPHWPAAAGSAIGCLGILVHSLIDFRLQRPGTALLFLVLIALLISLDRQPCESGKSQRS